MADVEAEVRAAVESEILADVTDPEVLSSNPTLGQYGGAITWTPINVRTPNGDPFDRVESPVFVKAGWEDDHHSSDVTVYRRVGGTFEKLDRFTSPVFGYTTARDYVLCNYGVEPKIGFGPIDSISCEDETRFPWLTEPATRNPPTDPFGGEESLRVDRLVSLLEDDRWYHPAAARLRKRGYEPDEDTLAHLQNGSRAERSTAARWLAATKPIGHEQFRQLVQALPETDQATQQLVAPILWDPPFSSTGKFPNAELAAALTNAYSCTTPAARAGVLTGAARIVGKIFERIESEKVSAEPDSIPDAVERALAKLVEKLAAGFEDEHRYVRFRAAALAAGELTMESGNWVFLRDDAIWSTVPFEQRWELARATESLTGLEDYDGGGTLLLRPSDDWLFEDVYDGDPATLPALIEYGWDEPGPRAPTVRSVVASIADDEPSTVADYVDRPIEAIRDGDPTPNDVRMVAALAAEAPEQVADIVPGLTSLLDSESDYRRAAARALSELAAVRPHVVEIDAAQLTEATTDVTSDDGVLHSDRLAALTAVDSDLAADIVTDYHQRIDGDDTAQKTQTVRALFEASEADPSLAADTADVLLDLVDLSSTTERPLDRAGLTLARGVLSDPTAFETTVDELSRWIGIDATVGREAIATALVTIGEASPSTVPTELQPLLDQSDQAATLEQLLETHERSDQSPDSSAAWPLGVLARDQPTFVADAIVEAIDTDQQWLRQRTEILDELYAAGEDVGDEVLERLIRSAPIAFLGDSYGTGAAEALFDESPERAAALADELVRLVAESEIEYWRDEPDRRTTTARTIERALRDAAASDPETVRSAIERHYESVEEFRDATATRDREAIATTLAS